MYRVLIVDDEPSARMGLRECYDFARFDCEFAAEAEDGVKALEILRDTKIDIVITDVKMPNMDGVELSREIARLYPHIKVILISGYNEIDYLKAALKVSAVDYILKPINLSELDSAVSQAAAKLKESEILLQKDITLMQSVPLLKEKFLLTLILDNIPSDEALKKQMHRHNISFPIDGKANVIVIRLNRMDKNMAEREYQRISFAVLNVCQELLEKRFLGYCFESGRGEYVCIVSVGENNENDIKKLSEEIENLLYVGLELEATAEAGRTVNGIRELKNCYLSVIQSVDYKQLLGKNRAVSAGGAYADNGKLDHELLQKLADGLRVGNYVEAKHLTDEFFDGIRAKNTLSSDYVQSMCLFLLFLPGRVAAEEEFETKIFSYDGQQQYEEMSQLDTIDEMKRYILNKFRELCDYVNGRGGEGTVINNVKSYIKRNYPGELTIKELAESVYLSYIFKQKTGMTINDYITDVRLEKAKELLHDPKNSIYDIACAVGYHESGYFTRIFKKYTGQTPSKYRGTL